MVIPEFGVDYYEMLLGFLKAVSDRLNGIQSILWDFMFLNLHAYISWPRVMAVEFDIPLPLTSLSLEKPTEYLKPI